MAAFQILEDFGIAGADRGPTATAHLGLRELAKPIKSSIVDSLGDIDTEIETAMVATSQD